jgi:hypothetical protein
MDMRDSDALGFQYSHYMKLLELFENRQTTAFNFALLVYGGAVATYGALSDKIMLPALRQGMGTPEADLAATTAVAIFSIVVPLFILPLCLLYSDVSIYCAALNVGNLTSMKEFGAEGVVLADPAIFAHRWLKKNSLEIDAVANGRSILFWISPIAGLILSALGALYCAVSGHVWSLIVVVPGFAVSGATLYWTSRADRMIRKARNRSTCELRRFQFPGESGICKTCGRPWEHQTASISS